MIVLRRNVSCMYAGKLEFVLIHSPGANRMFADEPAHSADPSVPDDFHSDGSIVILRPISFLPTNHLLKCPFPPSSDFAREHPASLVHFLINMVDPSGPLLSEPLRELRRVRIDQRTSQWREALDVRDEGMQVSECFGWVGRRRLWRSGRGGVAVVVGGSRCLYRGKVGKIRECGRNKLRHGWPQAAADVWLSHAAIILQLRGRERGLGGIGAAKSERERRGSVGLRIRVCIADFAGGSHHCLKRGFESWAGYEGDNQRLEAGLVRENRVEKRQKRLWRQ